jgi:glutamate/tyrosine decarboxylase-like PLP-dependent enzyme
MTKPCIEEFAVHHPEAFPHEPCRSEDIGLKSFFLGPQAENGPWVEAQVLGLLRRWFSWRRSQFPADGNAISAADGRDPDFERRQGRFGAALNRLLTELEGEVPKFSPRYVGHMYSEIGLPALLGHVAALLHNANNISGESARVGVRLEDEAIRGLLGMIGGAAGTGFGHFTSGGTVANYEALTRARARAALWTATAAATGAATSPFAAAHLGWREHDTRHAAVAEAELSYLNSVHTNPFEVAERLAKRFGQPWRGPVILVPASKHYSWTKGVELIGLGGEAFWQVPLDAAGRLSIAALRNSLARAEREGRPVALVVSVAGTTELGQFDPVDEVQDLLDALARDRGLHVWHHVDAAYGGFFASMDPAAAAPESPMQRALAGMARADSVTLDPHKLGYVPYACGAFLVRDERDYTLSAQKAPYIRFEPLDRGPYTIEGSRAATGAAATWMALESIGLDADGYGRILARTIAIRRRIEARLAGSAAPIRLIPDLEANIVGFTVAYPGETLSQANARAEAIAAALSPAGHGPFFVSKTTLYASAYSELLGRLAAQWNAVADTDRVVLVRMCILNPFIDSLEMSVRLTDELVATIEGLVVGPANATGSAP